jgi:hypothetical protein
MKKKCCVREGAFLREGGLWWLNKEQNEPFMSGKTPMTIALKNGGISRVIDVKGDGLSGSPEKRRTF